MGGGLWGQDWAKAGQAKSKNIIKVFKIDYLLRFLDLAEVKHPLE
jgi:hypothetical protein